MMKKILSFAVVAVAMMSCQKNETNISNDPQEIKLTAGVMQMVSDTKAPITGTAFAENAEIGLYGLSDGQTDWTAPFFNNSGAKVVGGAVVFTEKTYYPQDDKAVNFYAFYPKGTPAVTASDATVAYNLTTQDDILWATVKTGTLTNHAAENALTFGHKLAKINFKVKAGADFASGINVTAISVTTTNTTATLNVETGVLAFGTPGDLTAFTGTQEITATETAVAFGDVMIQPGEVYTIKVTAGGVDYTQTLTAAPAEGKAKTVTLTFLPTGVDVKTAITGWETVGGENADMQK